LLLQAKSPTPFVMFAVIRIPDFCLQAALRHEPEMWLKPVALIDEQEKKAAVFQMTSAARVAGVCEGLTSTQALARCGDVLIKPRSQLQERTVQETLLQTAYCFSPRTEATANGVCTMDLQGLSLFREANSDRISDWANKIISALTQIGLRVSVGIAQTPNLARHAARCAKPFFFVEDSTEFISRLPVESLEPPVEMLDILQRWGIRTVGEFTRLGKDSIAERLGPEGLELFDRASIDEVRPLDLIIPPENFSETIELEHEIDSLPPLFFILNRFVEQLANRISVSQQIVAELKLCLQLSSGDEQEFILKVPSPTGNKDALFRMLQTRLENVQTDSSVIALELSATPCRIEIHQFGLFEVALRDPNQFTETLARLSALCGAENVGTPFVEETHRPDAFKMLRPKFEGIPAADNLLHGEGLKLRRFRPALRAEVQLKNDMPASLSAGKLNGRIEKCSGPWRSSGDWWEQQRLWNRDEWDVQTRDGSLGRIYRENDQWFLEGIYD
jgi:protein ImuB